MALILTAITLSTATPAASLERSRPRKEVSIEVVSDTGRSMLTVPHKEYRNEGTRIIKKYLEAKQGENYGIVIRNTTPERIGVVIAVDGRNIISGKKSDLKNNENMYVINGYGHARYDGWRTDRDTVHRFYFTATDDSYAVRTFNDSSAMGVIAVAVYREKERPQPLYEGKKEHAPAAPSVGSSAKSRMGAQRDESAGTGFGDARHSPVITVSFEPEHAPVQKTLIKYEWREVLCRKGILSCRQEQGNRFWDQDEYAPYPPGYPVN
jgi:hypothetical protein